MPTTTSAHFHTDGRKQLTAWLAADPERSQSALARTLQIKQSSVSYWCSGRARPEALMRESLQLITGIEPTAWDTPTERALVKSVRKSVAAGAPERTNTPKKGSKHER